MMIHEITEKTGKFKPRKRIGRGRGSGSGKTSGRGHKGAGSRAGYSRRPAFEGGQMPYFRRIPKRGFSNSAFRTVYHIVNVSALQDRFETGATVDAAALVEAGLIRNTKNPVKVLAHGEITVKLNVTADKFSDSATKKIEAAGGSVTVVTPKKKWVRDYGSKKTSAVKTEAATEATTESGTSAPTSSDTPETPESTD
jgi:large subunit ribosomal protein L15